MSNFKHGNHIDGKKTAEYVAWIDLKQRCLNPKNKSFKNYGARGITVCDRWVNSFSEFLNDIGEKPSSSYSIDRIDVNGNYEPSNCKWSTKSEQEFNKRIPAKNKSGYVGVHFNKEKSKWYSHITVNKKHIHIGYFENVEQAAESRRLAELQYRGKSS